MRDENVRVSVARRSDSIVLMRKARSFLCLMLTALACLAADAPTTRPYVVGHLAEPKLRESSGIVESRTHPGVFWTHNDSGNEPIIYAVRRDGSLINLFRVDVVALDWEDIAIDDDGYLYLADIGNNGNIRAGIGVTRIDEPDPSVASDKKLKPQRQWVLSYADGQRMDSESMFVWKGDGYLIKKSFDHAPSTIWRFKLDGEKSQTLEYVATLPVDAMCTGADLARDGETLAVMSIDGPILFTGIGGDLKNVEKSTPARIAIPRGSNEAVCLTADGAVGTNEGRDVFFFPWTAFESPATRP